MSRRRGIAPSAIVSSQARLGRNVTVGDFTIVEDNVELGDDSVVGPHCILGEPTAAFYDDAAYVHPATTIGPRALIRSHSVVYAGCTIGSDLRTGHRVTVREGAVIGSHFQLGTGSDIQGTCKIGDYVRTQSFVFVPQYSTIEDYVWLFPGVTLTNDPHPPSADPTLGVTVRAYAVVGAGAVVLPGLTIGREAVVAAGAVLTTDVPDGELMVGAPARSRGKAADLRGRVPGVPAYPWRLRFSRGYPWA